MNFDPACQEAINLAKASLQQGEMLDIPHLLAAIYHAGKLKDSFPALAERLPTPRTTQSEKHLPSEPAAGSGVLPKVKLSPELKAALSGLRKDSLPVTVRELFDALAATEKGRLLLGESQPAVSPAPTWLNSPERSKILRRISAYGRLLSTSLPGYSPLVGVEDSLRALVRILSKSNRQNAIVIGPPRCGKTALVVELGQRIAQRDPSLPERLHDHDLFELDPSAFRAGTKYAGEYEKRVAELIALIRDARLAGDSGSRILLYIDEIHAFLASARHESSPFADANESFKKALANGDLTLIGSTTAAEYRHAIAPDKALAERFTEVRLEPPTKEQILAILHARRLDIAKHFGGLEIPESLLPEVLDLSEEHLPGKSEPDKSIQLLDDACAHCVSLNPPRTRVDRRSLEKVLESRLGYSIGARSIPKEAEVFDALCREVVGQDEALRGLAAAFVAGFDDWFRPRGPRTSVFLAGPTGVGKTSAAVVLAKILGRSRSKLLRIDCSTIQGSGRDSTMAQNQLLGSPPGFVGYQRGSGGLLGGVRDTPEAVVLFDEFDKADPGVGEIILRLLDEGIVQDSEGNDLDFRRSFIIFTSNAGVEVESPETKIGFRTESASGKAAQPIPRTNLDSLRKSLRIQGLGDEFLGRIQHIFVFKALTPDALAEIMLRVFLQLRDEIAPRGYALNWHATLPETLASKWPPRYGARPLLNAVRHAVTSSLRRARSEAGMANVRSILLDVGEPVVVPETPDTLVITIPDPMP